MIITPIEVNTTYTEVRGQLAGEWARAVRRLGLKGGSRWRVRPACAELSTNEEPLSHASLR
jgi:hypothetical protein